MAFLAISLFFVLKTEKSLCRKTQGGFFLGFSDFKKGKRIIAIHCAFLMT